MDLVQKWPFYQIFFLVKKDQQKVFYDIVERKNAFLGYKNRKVKKTKNRHFSRGVNPGFWSKNGQFSNFFFLGNIEQENIFYHILERKKSPFRLKKQEVQKVENLAFFERG